MLCNCYNFYVVLKVDYVRVIDIFFIFKYGEEFIKRRFFLNDLCKVSSFFVFMFIYYFCVIYVDFGG